MLYIILHLFFNPTMATLIPPPKRPKLYHNHIPEPEPAAVKPSPNVVVQFVSEEDGQSLAPAIRLPANATRNELETLLNRLTKKVDERV
jgi:ribosome assembly protein 4